MATWSQSIATALDTDALAQALNANLGDVRSVTFDAITSGTINVVNVGGIVKDAEGTFIPNGIVLLYLTDDATDGVGESDFSPSTAAPVQTAGTILYPLGDNGTTTTAMLVRADELGQFTLTYTDTAQEPFVLAALPDGATAPTLLEVVTGDYDDA